MPKHKVRLDPWATELESILAVSQQGLPFPVALPAGFATQASEIGTFRAKVKSCANMGTIFNPVSAFDPVICLIFYKSGKVEELMSSVPKILEGKASPKPGELHILTVIEAFNHKKDVVWKMSKERVQQMQEEKWYMSAYRIENNTAGGFLRDL